MTAIDHLQQVTAGAATLTDWLGDGGIPVEQSLAENRAQVCQQCPKNVERDWWLKHTDAIALTIRKWLALKLDAGLELPNEDALAMCKCCGCCLKLKLFVPIEHIKSHTSTKTFESYPSFCWVRKEVEALT